MKSDEEVESWEEPSPEPHGRFGGCLLVLVLIAVAVVAVRTYDVPYVDDWLESDYFDREFLAALWDDFRSTPAEGNLVDALDDTEQALQESSTRAPAGAQGHREEPIEERPPYEGPNSVYMAEGFDPDAVATLDFGGDSNGEDSNLPRLLTDVQIQRVVNSHQQELLDCYADELRYDPDISGTVYFDFAVDPDGRVLMVRVTRSTLESNFAEDCFVEQARNWRFPATNQATPTRFETDFSFSI